MYAAAHAAAHPDQPALIMAASGEVITYGEYEARANRLAHLLRNQGLRRGDHIAVLMENSAEMLIIEGAAERAGLYYTLVNSYLAAAEVAYIVDNCRARVFFTSQARSAVARQAAVDCPHLELRLLVGAADGDDDVLASGWEPYDSALAGLSGGPIADERLGAAMLYSSGTTGRPKGILRPLPDVEPGER
jgi:long-chain acyl-CoA synthetase